MFANILVAFDGTGASQRAFASALQLGQRCACARLQVVSAIGSDGSGAAECSSPAVAGSHSYYKGLSAVLCAQGGRMGMEVEHCVLIGEPAQVIVSQAAGWHADLIVMGHSRRSLVERWIRPSVSRYVMARADCPVLVVR